MYSSFPRAFFPRYALFARYAPFAVSLFSLSLPFRSFLSRYRNDLHVLDLDAREDSVVRTTKWTEVSAYTKS